MHPRTAVCLLIGALVATALTGCANSGRKPASPSDGLEFTVERVSSAATGTLAVRVTLRNVSDRSVSWPAIRFGAAATAVSKVATNAPGGVSVGIGQPYGNFEGAPLTLRSGEATSAIRELPVGPGTWRVVGAYISQGEEPHGRSAPIVVVVP